MSPASIRLEVCTYTITVCIELHGYSYSLYKIIHRMYICTLFYNCMSVTESVQYTLVYLYICSNSQSELACILKERVLFHRYLRDYVSCGWLWTTLGCCNYVQGRGLEDAPVSWRTNEGLYCQSGDNNHHSSHVQNWSLLNMLLRLTQ